MDIFSDKKVLIVDDLPHMRSSIKHMLQMLGFAQIDATDSGDNALGFMQRKSYDAVLCDYNLGKGRDGQQVLEEARARGLIRADSVFMVITAEQTQPLVMKVVEYGPDDYLAKPFTKETLRTRLIRLLEKKDKLSDVDKALSKGRFAEALAICDRRIEEGEIGQLELLKIKGELLIKLGHYEAAEDHYKKIINARDFHWARLGVAISLYERQKYRDAERVLENLIEDEPLYVSAYDLMAKVHIALGDVQEAQKFLERALEQSPEAILRQKKLGKLALRNDDPEKAEEAYRAAIRLGTYSCYKSSADYIGLAKVLVERSEVKEAMKVIDNTRKSFADDKEAALHASITECTVFLHMKEDKKADEIMRDVEKQYRRVDDKVSEEVSLDMAKACFRTGRKELGEQILTKLAPKNHNPELESDISDIRNFVREMESGTTKKSGAPSSEDSREITDANKIGIKLAEQGKLLESIMHFEEAAESYPESLSICLNTAHATIVHMQRSGENSPGMLKKARKYLYRAENLGAGENQRYKKLAEAFKALGGVLEG